MIADTETKTDDNSLNIDEEQVTEKTFKRCVSLAIRDLLSETGSTPRKVASHVSLDAAFLRRVVAGKRTIGLFTLFKIAAACEVTPADIIGKIEEHLKDELETRAGK